MLRSLELWSRGNGIPELLSHRVVEPVSAGAAGVFEEDSGAPFSYRLPRLQTETQVVRLYGANVQGGNMASRATKITLWVVGGIVGLIILAVIALVAWAAFRPLLVGDYNHTYGYVRTVNDLNEVPLAAMVASVGMGSGADGSEQYANRISNTLGQIDVITDEVDEAITSRAAVKDEQLQQRLNELNAAYEDLTATLSSWEEDGYAPVADAAEKCLGDDMAACNEAVVTAKGSGSATPLLADMLTSAESVANGGSTTDLEADRSALSDATAELWAAVEGRADAVTEYLMKNGDGVE